MARQNSMLKRISSSDLGRSISNTRASSPNTPKSLDLSHEYLSPDNINELHSILLGNPDNTVIKHGFFGKLRKLVTDIAKKISPQSRFLQLLESCKITELELDSISPNRESIPALSDLFKDPHIKCPVISLRNNKLEDQEAETLMKAILGNDNIEEVDLSRNKLTDKFLEFLSSDLPSLKHPVTIILEGNPKINKSSDSWKKVQDLKGVEKEGENKKSIIFKPELPSDVPYTDEADFMLCGNNLFELFQKNTSPQPSILYGVNFDELLGESDEV